mgnify:CR=1 FL=1
MDNSLKILLCAPRGFCAGVDRAVDIVEKSLEKFGSPIYVRHEIVHNKHVVQTLEKKGVIFVNELEEIKDKKILETFADVMNNMLNRVSKGNLNV